VRNLICGMIALLVCGTAWSQSSPSAAETEKAVAALEAQWLAAEKSNTPDAVAPLLADKYVYMSATGISDKAQFLETLRGIKFASAENADVNVTVFGHTAIVTGTFKANGAENGGKAFSEHVRWTDTWVKMPSGKWQCVATAEAAIEK
jgi:ketosteroid isomerase-like protein